MELLTHFESYIHAQKNVGTHFIIVGVLLLTVAAWSYTSGTSPLNSGLTMGAFICALLIVGGGLGYRYTETALLKTQTELFHKDQSEFRKIEMERMTKVQKDYRIYQFVFSTFIVAALLVILFVKNPYWHGVSFAVIILLVGTLIIEAFSNRSIVSYFNNLVN